MQSAKSNSLLQPFLYPCRISSAIKNCMNQYRILIHPVINSKRKPLRQHTEISFEINSVNTCMYLKGINIGKQRIQKIFSESFFLFLIKQKAFFQIFLSGSEYFNFHGTETSVFAFWHVPSP